MKKNDVEKNENYDLISFNTPLFKRDFFILVAIILFGAVLIFLQRFMEPEMGRDSTLYVLLIEKWSHGGFARVLEYWPDFGVPPLFVYLGTLLTYTGLSPENAAMVISMGCGILMPLVTFAIAGEIFHDRRISLAAALLTAFNPSIIEMSVQAQRDVPYLFTAGWSIYLIIAGIHRNKWYWWCAAGCVWGLALSFRFEILEFLPVLGMYFIFAVRKKKEQWIIYLKNTVIFTVCGGFIAIAVLYMTGTAKMIFNEYKDRIAFNLLRPDLTKGGQQK